MTSTSATQVTASETTATCRRCRRDFELRTVLGPITGAPIVERRVYCVPCEAAIQEEEDQRALGARAEAEERRKADCLRELDPPEEFADVTLQSVKFWGSAEQQQRTGRALQISRRIVGEVAAGLRPPVFCVYKGRPGNGKTMLAWAIARELAGKHGKKTRVIRLSALIRDLRSGWGTKSQQSEEKRLRYWIGLDFLAIDEVTRDAFYGNPKQHLIELISERIDDRRPTLITTNDELPELEKLLGWQLMSRLALGGMLDFGDVEDFRQLSSDERPRD